MDTISKEKVAYVCQVRSKGDSQMKPTELKRLIEKETYYGFNLGMALYALNDTRPELFEFLRTFFNATELYRHDEAKSGLTNLIETLKNFKLETNKNADGEELIR